MLLSAWQKLSFRTAAWLVLWLRMPPVALARRMVRAEQSVQQDGHYTVAPMDWEAVSGKMLTVRLLAYLKERAGANSISDHDVIALVVIMARFDRVPNALFSRLGQVFECAGAAALGQGAMFQLCLIYFRAGRDRQLIAALPKAIKATPNARQRAILFDMHFNVAFSALMPWNRNQTQAECNTIIKRFYDIMRAAEANLPANWRNISIYRGYISCAEGNYAAALDHLHKAQQQEGYNLALYLNYELAVTMPRFAELARSEPSFPYGQRRFRYRHKKPDRAHLVSCDKSYFDLYIHSFLKGFARSNPGGLVHIHAVDFEVSDAVLVDLEKAYCLLINTTSDFVPEAGNSAELRRGYAAGARYIWLADYLEAYDFVVITDIDGTVDYELETLAARADADVFLKTAMFRNGGANPMIWTRILAGTFAARSTAETVNMSHAISAYLLDRFEHARRNGSRYFFSDQMALAIAHLHFREQIRFAEIPALYSQSKNVVHAPHPRKNLSIFKG